MSEGTGVLDDLLAEAAASGPDAVVDRLGADDVARLAQEISTPGELRRLVEFAGDDTRMIDRLVERILGKAGSDLLLDRVFDLMPGRFLGDRLRNERGTIEWHVTTPDGPKVYHLKIADGVAESGRGAAGNPRVTLTLSAPDLLRLCAGTLNGLTAFMKGSIKLNGDMLFGAKLPAAFDTSAE
ncbi:SCP2 sterol-binding domain-containing protein [Actinomadura rayongensis]|uniref:SCP2 domain-containing protein n=1 Tax=Actinomadura rayongensis TaxID=1429076 RepID=A0A6I4W862_9ACTN|nr:SCP2 sterol-binding domain-containing protein [Actinomadura rayongensis]MXQ66307.1 hypothetical protein [Actinomadura rayongensis]